MRRLAPILAVLLLAAVTRIVNAGHWPVWTDEGWSTWAASDHHIDVILDRVAQDRHPPLYFLTLSGWWTLAGDSRIALRFLGIASGLLTVAVVYRTGADWFGQRTGVYGALLLAVLNIAVYFSQEIRHYGWLMLAVSLMTLTFLRYLRRPRPAILIAYSASVAFMFYSLYIGVLVLALQVGIGLLVWRGSWRHKGGLILAWIAALILYAPWLIAVSQQLNILVGGIDGYPTNLQSLLTVTGLLFGGQMALTVGLYLIGAWQVIQERKLAPAITVLSGAGLLAFMFVANLRVGMLSPRTLVYLTPMLMLICGYGLSLIPDRARDVLALALVIVSLATNSVIQPRLDSAAAASAVAADYTPGDLIILENGWDDNAVRYEVMLALPDGESAEIIRTLPWVKNRNEPDQPVVPQVEDAIKAHQRVWIVNWLQPSEVIPFLDNGGDGFMRALTRQTSTGAQYKDLYADPVMHEVLFEKPDLSAPPRAYGNDHGDWLALRDALIPASIERGSTLHVDLWWSAHKPLPFDYSVGVFLLDASGTVQAQHDGAPGEKPTTQWQPGALQFDRHNLHIPADLPPGTYSIGVQVYWYVDRQPLLVGGEKYATVGQITVR